MRCDPLCQARRCDAMQLIVCFRPDEAMRCNLSLEIVAAMRCNMICMRRRDAMRYGVDEEYFFCFIFLIHIWGPRQLSLRLCLSACALAASNCEHPGAIAYVSYELVVRLVALDPHNRGHRLIAKIRAIVVAVGEIPLELHSFIR